MAAARPTSRAHRRTGVTEVRAVHPRRSRSARIEQEAFGVLSGLCVFRGFVLVIALGAIVAAQERPDRSKPPELAPPPQLELPSIIKRTLSNGLPVWLAESHEVPIVQVNLVVRAGAGDDPAATFGTASFTAAMLDEGAGGRSALEIADAVEFLGANLTTTSGFDASAIRLNVPAQRLEEGLAILADVAIRPTFPAGEVDRLRQERL